MGLVQRLRCIGYNGVQCWLVYRIPTNRAAGFRTYDDFRGSKLSFSLREQPSLFAITTLRFHLGVGGQRALFLHAARWKTTKAPCAVS
jgi:hypothetical protein